MAKISQLMIVDENSWNLGQTGQASQSVNAELLPFVNDFEVGASHRYRLIKFWLMLSLVVRDSTYVPFRST